MVYEVRLEGTEAKAQLVATERPTEVGLRECRV